MRPAPETGNELPPFLSGGLTYPEEEKILCKKREQGTRITCSPGSNTELFTEMKGNKRFIFRLGAAVAVFFSPFPLQAGECTLMSYNVKNGTGMDGRRDYDRTARVIAEENRMSWPFRSWTRGQSGAAAGIPCRNWPQGRR